MQRESKMTDEVAIKVDHVSKKYCKSLKRSMLYGMKDIGRNIFGMSSHSENLRNSEFWALDDISFEVKKGETLGIIGPNGSGKTTLLKLLNGIFWPDKGKITIKGKVGALIAVGAGFHPLLTGRENIYINGAILGISKRETNKKFDSIVDFADIGDFIDSPVKYYSSGMFVRLGFAVAIHCEPEILLIDEILAVGDIKFREKCQRKFKELRYRGTSIVFVSHTLETVRRVCNRALILDKGNMKAIGDVSDIISKYSYMLNKRELASVQMQSEKVSKLTTFVGTGDIILTNCRVYQEGRNKDINEIEYHENIVIEFNYHCEEVIENPEFRVGINTAFNNQRICNLSSRDNISLSDRLSGDGKIRFLIKKANLYPQVFTVDIAVIEKNQNSHLFYFNNAATFLVKEPENSQLRFEYANLTLQLNYITDVISF